MKKIIFSLAFASASAFAFAQTTMDFETWTGTGTGIEPKGWISANELTLIPGNLQSAFQETTPANVHSGSNALKLVSINNPSAIAGLPNPIGLAAPGTNVSFSPKFGFPYTGRPSSMSFYYKYTPAAGDTAECGILLWNSTTHDTIAAGIWKQEAAISVYTQETLPLIYNPLYSAEQPDSMALTFSSTRLFTSNYKLCLTCGTAGSTLWVDDISFVGWNSVNETEMSKGVSVFPNPATAFTTITVEDVNEASAVEVFDITGRSISTTALTQSSNAMNKRSAIIATQGMSAGLYSLSVYDKNKHILRSGKLNVVK